MKFKSLAILVALAISSTAHAQDTAFTYQGRLNANGAPADGNYDFEFLLYPTNQGGFPVGPVPFTNAIVTNGLFTVTVDFGPGLFTGSNYWLDIYVRTNGAASFNELSPRQPITPTPYAIMAATADTANTALVANSANNLPGLIVQQNTNSPNIIGGSSVNFVSNGVVGATIAGGGALDYFGEGPQTNSVTGDFGTVGGGTGNSANVEASVGGGLDNTASGQDSTIGGGYFGVASGDWATIAGGEINAASGSDATIGGGNNNTAYGQASTIAGGDGNYVFYFADTVGGGWANTAAGQYATVPGGYNNTASGGYSFAAGQSAQAKHLGAFVWADSQSAAFASTSSNQFLIRAKGGVGINFDNPQAPLHVIGGGDASLTGGGNIISGLTDGQNLVIDNNEIISRNNGAASDLILNNASGNVGIGRTPSANKLEVAGNASKSTAGSWLANSDARIKTDVQTVTNALDTLSRVRLVQFRYTDNYRATHPDVADHPYLNVVAQEFQQVFPDEVKSSGEKLANGDNILQVDTYPLTIYSAAAVQELSQQLKEKSARITALENELTALKAAVEKLAGQKE